MRRAALAAFLLLLLPGFAQASELKRFTAAVAKAYGHYRGAVFYLRTGNPAVAHLELQSAREIWNGEVLAFRNDPPDAFSDDAAWVSTLDGIGERLARAEAAAAAGDTVTARDTLAPVRGALAALRARNNVRVFSDCIDAISAAVDRLWVFRKEPPDLTDRRQVNALKAATAVAAYLFRRCQSEAPPEIAGRPEFRRIVDGTVDSLDRMWDAIDGKNQAAVISILREIRAFEGMLWLRFG